MRGKIRSLVLYILNLRYLLKIQIQVLSRHLVMGLEFRGEAWTVNIHLIVIKMYLVFKVIELNDISKEVDVNRKDLMRSEGRRMWYPRSKMKTFLNEDQGGLLGQMCPIGPENQGMCVTKL